MKSNLKRLLSMLLTLALLLSIWPGEGLSVDRQTPGAIQGELTNPLYPQILEGPEIWDQASAIALAGEPEYVSQEEAVVLLREAMVAREPAVTINIYAPQGEPNIKTELFPATYQDTQSGINRGDYLRWSWWNVKWDGTNLGEGYYSYLFRLTYYTTGTQEAQLLERVNGVLEELSLQDKTDYQEAKAVYDYIAGCADYDHAALARVQNGTGTQEDYLIFTAYGAMIRGKAVCQGYACLLYAMCQAAGLPVRMINNNTHAWNIVKLGDRWYNMDVTWDGQDQENRSDYFLKGSAAFPNHQPAAEFLTDSFQQSYPISTTDYVLTDQDSCTTHSFDDGVMTVPACTGTGTRVYTCQLCGYTRSQSVAMTGHHHEQKTKPASCTEPGSVYYVCAYCGDSYEEESLAALGHKYEQTVVSPTCTVGGYTAHSCVRCGDYYVNQETEALGHSWDQGQVTTEPTESTPGEITYTCTVCRNTKKESVLPLQHSYDQGQVTTEPGCLTPGEITYTCADCGQEYPVEIPAKGHSWDSGQVTKTPTEGQRGVRTYTCTACGDTRTESITLVTHHFDEGTVLSKATCVKEGKISYACTDEDCDYCYEEVIPATELGHHHEKKTTEPTCTEDGAVMAVCTYCGDNYEEEHLKALGHKDQTTVQKPTCTTAGKTVTTCGRCGRVEETTQSATGHSYIKSVVEPTCTAAGYTTHTCRYCGESYVDGERGKIPHEYQKTVVAPTCTVKGYTSYTCIHCQDSYRADYKDATSHRYGQVPRYASGASTVEKTYICIDCGREKKEILQNPFRDVEAGIYYYEPILWAADQGIAKGMTDVTFEPALECTRAQVLTFLWRSVGAPRAKTRTCPFTDVEPGSWYYEAVLWAVEQNITKGMSSTTFEPNTECTRAHVVTFLWRVAGQPKATKRTCSFTDVIKGEFYYDAMLWAVEQNITNGMGNNCFEPNTICTRGQVVTFLYRSR